VVLLLFGGKKIPELMKGLGTGLKEFKNASKEDEGIMQALSFADGLIAILVESWTLDLVLPSVKISVLDELEMADYDFLTEETKEVQKVLFPKLDKTDETEQDVESPFADSND
jgi:TatA/E family protein of Tat protein translocase